MNSIEDVIKKVLEIKAKEDLEEVKVDLKRIIEMQGIDSTDMGYINYLFKHYQNEINMINRSALLIDLNRVNYNISPKDDIRNYLIKIVLIRECKEKGINYEIEKMNNVDYCIGLLNVLN